MLFPQAQPDGAISPAMDATDWGCTRMISQICVADEN